MRPVNSDARRLAVAILTFRRPGELLKLLDSLDGRHITTWGAASVYVFNNAPEPISQAIPAWATVVEIGAGGVAAGRNAAIEVVRARGFDYVAFVDDDQIATPEWLQSLVQCASLHPSAVAIAGPVQPTGLATRREELLHRRQFRPTGANLRAAGGGNLLISLDRLQDRRFDEAFDGGGEDTELTLRLTLAGETIVWCADAMCYEVVASQRRSWRYVVRRNLHNGEILYRAHAKLCPEPRARLAVRALLAGLSPFVLPIALLNGSVGRWFLDNQVRNLGYMRALIRRYLR